MVKSEKTGLGRALVKQHNQMIQESKEKGRFYKSQQRTVLESVTEVSDIAAIVERSDALSDDDEQQPPQNLLPFFHCPPPDGPITLDGNSLGTETSPEERRELQRREEALHASSLRIPRRPQWNAGMTVEELDASEKKSFLTWRRNLASLEENENLVLTPFEKNLDIWRQLWRVVERSDLLVMVVDARDPLFYRCLDLEAYAQEVDENKKTMLLINKADLLPQSAREKWAEYFHLHQILFVFWSAKAAYEALAAEEDKEDESNTVPKKSVQEKPKISVQEESESDDTKVFGKDELLSHIQAEAEKIAKARRESSSSVPESSALKSVTVGFVGYPNVGKSSTINALLTEKRAGVTSTPGKTKHFQTFIISNELTLCDCPGLVFPSFTSSRHEMVASGVLPIDRMTEHREALQVVANRVPRSAIEQVYNIKLPRPKSYEPQSRPPLAAELLKSYCLSRGHVASSGLPDETRAARQILKDYLDGKLPHYEAPPGMVLEGDEGLSDDSLDNGKENGTVEDETANAGPTLEHVLEDLNSFDVSQGLAPGKAGTKKERSSAAHKQHKKPQRKKDRTWRVGNDGGDGMPAVKGLQKVPNIGPLKVSQP